MKINTLLTEDAILLELGQRISRLRIDKGLTQAALAEQAGVSKSTVERIENGASSQLSSLIRILRVLELLERLEELIPEPAASPVEMLRAKTRPRQRASSRKKKPASGWRWGDR